MRISVSKRMMDNIEKENMFVLEGVLGKLPMNYLNKDDVVEFVELPYCIKSKLYTVTNIEKYFSDLLSPNKRIYVKEI